MARIACYGASAPGEGGRGRQKRRAPAFSYRFPPLSEPSTKMAAAPGGRSSPETPPRACAFAARAGGRGGGEQRRGAAARGGGRGGVGRGSPRLCPPQGAGGRVR